MFIHRHFLGHYHKLREPIQWKLKETESEIVEVINSAHLIVLLIARFDLHDC